jgi:hypothetical protein
MQKRYDPETVDRTLQDIRNCDKPFGGITVVFGGDFQQILPVVPRGSREDIVWASLKRSPLWRNIRELKLKTNMRLEQNPENQQYAEWLLKVGHGTNSVEGKVHFPDSMKCESNSIDSLINSIYPAIQVPGTTTDNYLLERTILCPRNEEVNSINAKVTEKFPGQVKVYLSADTVEMPGDEPSPYPIEFINSLNASGLPLHKLELKEGCPIMLM